ncbi:pantoate--beta-alanine ligase [Spongiivirga sp. MCCC 1A20706]|uniref:pantoate--beta-alanine ligase n=1 Tax=Spongiivirga sp. MCCC 1A20706 TaxID=3160963 RepID=UPI0039776408
MVFTEKSKLSAFVGNQSKNDQSVGLVPTMGALHKGHLALIQQSTLNNALTIVSIFVNPTQFDNPTDLVKYPRTLDEDVKLIKSLKKNVIVYAPTPNDVYNGNVSSQKFDFDGLENEMEGEFRNGHFDGVGTVVKRLLEIVEPDRAYFGEKDFQQLQIIRKLVKKYKIPVEIVGCPISREDSGLAMSSRNKRLTEEEREKSAFIYKTLRAARAKFGTESANKVVEWVTEQFETHSFLRLEYFKIAEVLTLKSVKRKTKNKKYRAFIAVYANDVRLIDNLALN